MEPVTLPLDDITLRPPAAGDLDALAEAFTDPEIRRWTLAPESFTGDMRASFLSRVAQGWQNDECYRWIVTDTGGGALLGMVALLARRHGAMELVYWATPGARGRGVTERAARGAIEWAFDTLGTARVEWDAVVGNHVSRLLALKLGFRMTGTRRSALAQRGERRDLWTGELLPGELLDEPPAGYDVRRARAVAFAAPQPVLRTERPDLSLRPMTEDDVDLIAEASRDPETATWTTVPVPYRRSHAEGFLSLVRQWWREGVTAAFVLSDADGKYCGTIDLRLYEDDPDRAEIGFATAPWARGKGYMTAALRAICDYGFEVMGCERILWKAYVGNDGSQRVAEKAGFVMEGTLRSAQRHRGEPRDCLQASLLRGDWEKNR